MGLMPPPTSDSGWKPAGSQGEATCHICGTTIYTRNQIVSPGRPSDWRMLVRHGEEGGAITEICWDDAAREFVMPECDPAESRPGFSGWEMTFEKQAHARERETVAA